MADLRMPSIIKKWTEEAHQPHTIGHCIHSFSTDSVIFPVHAAADLWNIHVLQCISLHLHTPAHKDIHWTLSAPLLLQMAYETASLCL